MIHFRCSTRSIKFGDPMGKLEIKFKLTGLEFEIKGESDDVIAKAAAMQRQIQGMLGTVGVVTDGADTKQSPQGPAGMQILEAKSEPTQNGNRAKRSVRRATGERTSAEPIDFRHDASKFGNPLQSWGGSGKCIWLLHVLDEMSVVKEVSGPQLAATFNHHFKAAGTVRPSHTTRELGRAKIKNPAMVGEDKSSDPSLWFLTDEGKKYARQLVESVLNPS
jgi:hypothetical protein